MTNNAVVLLREPQPPVQSRIGEPLNVELRLPFQSRIPQHRGWMPGRHDHWAALVMNKVVVPHLPPHPSQIPDSHSPPATNRYPPESLRSTDTLRLPADWEYDSDSN